MGKLNCDRAGVNLNSSFRKAVKNCNTDMVMDLLPRVTKKSAMGEFRDIFKSTRLHAEEIKELLPLFQNYVTVSPKLFAKILEQGSIDCEQIDLMIEMFEINIDSEYILLVLNDMMWDSEDYISYIVKKYNIKVTEDIVIEFISCSWGDVFKELNFPVKDVVKYKKAFHIAIFRQNEDVINELLDQFSDLIHYKLELAFSICSRGGHYSIIERYLKVHKFKDINRYFWLFIRFCTYYDTFKTAQLYIENGGSIDYRHHTFFRLSIASGDEKAIKLLVKCSRDEEYRYCYEYHERTQSFFGFIIGSELSNMDDMEFSVYYIKRSDVYIQESRDIAQRFIDEIKSNSKKSAQSYFLNIYSDHYESETK